MRLLVNIRGCNGAGKSTVPKLMLEQDCKVQVIGIGERNGKPAAPYLTVFPSFRWVALGTYHSNTGGMDTFKNNEMTRQALYYALENFPDYDILMEGVIASTVKSTYAQLFHEVEHSIDRKILITSFLPPVEVCIARVYERNGGKPVKEEQIEGKWRTVDRNVNYFKEQGFTSIRINTAKVTRDKMLIRFLQTCDKYREV